LLVILFTVFSSISLTWFSSKTFINWPILAIIISWFGHFLSWWFEQLAPCIILKWILPGHVWWIQQSTKRFLHFNDCHGIRIRYQLALNDLNKKHSNKETSVKWKCHKLRTSEIINKMRVHSEPSKVLLFLNQFSKL